MVADLDLGIRSSECLMSNRYVLWNLLAKQNRTTNANVSVIKLNHSYFWTMKIRSFLCAFRLRWNVCRLIFRCSSICQTDSGRYNSFNMQLCRHNRTASVKVVPRFRAASKCFLAMLNYKVANCCFNKLLRYGNVYVLVQRPRHFWRSDKLMSIKVVHLSFALCCCRLIARLILYAPHK